MNNDQVLKVVFSKMMLLFNVNRIEILRVEDMTIKATVGWPDEGQPYYDPNEEQQDVVWHTNAAQLTQEVSMCIEFLIRNSVVKGDRISIDENELLLRIMNVFGWGINRARAALDALLSIKITMIDEGVPTDEFFLHF